MRRLTHGQWDNGFLPHIIYTDKFPYSYEGIGWGTSRYSPKGVSTSGVTQPPMLAIAVERVAAALGAKAGREFVRAMMPTLILFHQWLYRERDPHHTGLPACLHPWECGLDDTPYWTQALDHLPNPPWYWRLVRDYHPHRAAERASVADSQHSITLGLIIKRHHFDSRQLIEGGSPVVIQDLVFNSVLAAANESLERLAELSGVSLPADLHKHFAPTRRALEKLWDPDYDRYYSRDVRTGRLITISTVATFMPLFAGTASQSRAAQLRDLLHSGSGFNTPFPVPSVPTSSPYFEARRYWRGPVWINMNWFIIRGLERYGFTQEATALRQSTLDLIDHSGFREFYNASTGDGLGAHNFSWTAALALDLL